MSGLTTFGRSYRPGAVAARTSGGPLVARGTRRYAEFSGDGALAGLVTIRGVPARRELLCFDVISNALVATIWSDAATGAFRFDGLNKTRRFRVEAIDYAHQYNAVVADAVYPE